MIKKVTYCLLILLFSALYFALIYNGSTNSDYLLYSYKFSLSPQEGAPWPLIHEKVSSFKDIIYSQYVHYLFVNGRSIVHTIVQLFTSFIRYDICCIIATIMYAITLVLGEKVCFNGQEQRWFPSFIFIVGIFAFCCEPAVIYSMVTTINYLWPITFSLCFILLFHHKLGAIGKSCFFIISFITGWSHEAIAIPLSASFFFYLLIEKRKLKPYQIAGILFLIIGTAFTICAPGNYVKFSSAQQAPSMWILLKQHIYMIVYLRITYILTIALFVLALQHKLLNFVHEYKYWFIALAASIGFVFLVGAINPRSTFFIEIIAGALLCFIINKYLSTAHQRALTTLIALVIIPLYSSAIFYRIQIKENRKQIEAIIASSTNDTVIINSNRVHVPFIVSSYASGGSKSQKELYRTWNNAVYQFAYDKKVVDIRYNDPD